MYIYHPRGVFLAGYDCLKEIFYALMLRFVYITFSLLTELAYVPAEDFDGIDLI